MMYRPCFHCEGEKYDENYCPEICTYGEARKALAAYEATGLLPETILTMSESLGRFAEVCKGVGLNRIRELVQAEVEGQLVVLPCKAGEIVWLIDTRFFQRDKSRLPVVRCMVNEFSSDGTHTYIVLDGAEPWYKMQRFRAVDIADFGRILFKTKQEAAAALGRDIDVPCKKEG